MTKEEWLFKSNQREAAHIGAVRKLEEKKLELETLRIQQF